jgi:hypothetical protein
MFRRLSDTFKTATAFLQNGVAPPNTPPAQQTEMENTNHMASKKFFITFSGFIILGVFYASSIAVLFALSKNPELTAAFSTMFAKTIEVFATIMAVYIGGQAVVDLKYNSTSNAAIAAEVQIIDITKKEVGNEKEDDFELHDD